MRTWMELGIIIPADRSGELDTTCPRCSPTRKKKTLKCLSINTDKGTWHCAHCGWSGSLHTGEHRTDPVWRKPVYRKPDPPKEETPLDPALKWFLTRGIPQDVVLRNKIFGTKIYMPQVELVRSVIAFPYLRNGEVINYKYRTPDKLFRMETGAERILYGYDDIDNKSCTIVEGECFPGDAEILTSDGWVRLDAYSRGKVLQVWPDGHADFEYPICKVAKRFRGELLRKEVKGWVSVTTPRHRLIGASAYTGDWCTYEAQDHVPSNRLIPRVALVSGRGIPLTDAQLKLSIAISADAAIREQGHYRQPYAVFGFKKERKVARLREILAELDIRASDTRIANDYYSICFHIPSWAPGRYLPWAWIADATYAQRELLLSELVHWDGNNVPRRTQAEYSTKLEENATWVQTLCHTSGRCSSVIPRSNEHGSWFKVSILHGKRHSSWQRVRESRIPYEGHVYCVTVPSGFILVRQENKITVSGNCDKLAVETAGITSCVSVPDGAPTPDTRNYASKFTFLDDPRLESVQQWIIAVDADPPGVRLEQELVRRLGVEKCLKVTWPEGCKDANEVLSQHGIDALGKALVNAKPYPVEGVIEVGDLVTKLEALYTSGVMRGLSTGWSSLDPFYTVRAGEWTVVTGIPSSGKSNWVDALTVNLAKRHEWKFAVFSPENQPLENHVSRIIEHYARKPFRDGPTPRMTLDEMHRARDWAHAHFQFILPPDDAAWTVSSILEKALVLIRRQGTNGIVIDPWNEMEHSRPGTMSETEYISVSLKQLRQFARRNFCHIWLVAHPTKLYRGKDGQYPVPTLYDISGSSHWRNKADNGIVVWRDFNTPDSPKVQILTQKIRFREIGKIGMCELRYDLATGGYYDIAPAPALPQQIYGATDDEDDDALPF